MKLSSKLIPSATQAVHGPTGLAIGAGVDGAEVVDGAGAGVAGDAAAGDPGDSGVTGIAIGGADGGADGATGTGFAGSPPAPPALPGGRTSGGRDGWVNGGRGGCGPPIGGRTLGDGAVRTTVTSTGRSAGVYSSAQTQTRKNRNWITKNRSGVTL